MAKQLDPNCGENFAIWAGNVYFQAGSKGLYRVPCDGSANAKKLDPNAGYLSVPGDSYVYFQAGDKGLYRVPCDGSADAKQLDPNAGYLVAPGDGYVYFQAGDKGLYRVPCDGSVDAKRLDPNCGENFAIWASNVYFQAGDKGLYRVPCDGSADARQLDPNAGYLLVPGDGYVYFQAGDKGLYRVPCDGSADAHRLDPNCGENFAIWAGDVYFQAGDKGLYRVPCDGSADAHKLDENAGHLVVPGDGYVYFQAGNKGLYRVRCDGSDNAHQLDPNCGNLVDALGYIYFQGGPNWDALYRLGVATPAIPAGLKMRVQNEYVVDSILSASIDAKYNAIKNLLDEADKDSSDTWFINFTSGASTGAYPNAVADRINGSVETRINELAVNKQCRLGTIMMDFANDYQLSIDTIFNYNSNSPFAPQDWMDNISDQKKLSEITIPGTHNSCTFNAGPISKCQNLELDKQLEAGIRFIDIRCRNYEDKFLLYHGIEYLKLDFDYVLARCREFLKNHGRECIVMLLQEEGEAVGNNKTFEEVFNEYVQADAGLWYLKYKIPALTEDVRGKIILLRRFYISPDSDGTKMGIDITEWPDNATFTWP